MSNAADFIVCDESGQQYLPIQVESSNAGVAFSNYAPEFQQNWASYSSNCCDQIFFVCDLFYIYESFKYKVSL